ncbi:molybdopterin synthase catalytic subunit [Anoplophora glabripennis]|uniref:molybdopterin synthase catalytic subunit n=1 Tax=Anoplophora glabripennis TaxID=217634 RepID=UPI0008738594|nr:molybdopterin synthase catalytic subunit [Anoplophora glabripennis]XP_018576789.1 molybdopterin synthase catalytic subunit [Anoplophora glabripennis]
MDHLKFTNEKISVEEVTGLVISPSCGAVSVFMGTTRDHFGDKPVVKLEYEAYEPMGMKALKQICCDIREEWSSVENIAIYHRLGVVPVQETSIVIAISSPHREEAIKATEWCINSVKKLVPIWKKEFYADADSNSQWKENKESSPYPPKLKKNKFEFQQKVDVPYVPPYLIQVNASKAEVDERITKFMERKRTEIDTNNIREFCCGDRNSEFTCARIDAVLQKRKDSKSHLEVNRVLNSYQHRDQTNSDYLRKFIPPNGIEERLQNLECQLSLTTVVPKNIYNRLKSLEDRLLYLESVSPEYLQFWDKTTPAKAYRKKIYTIEELDELIAETEKKIKAA